VLPSRVKALQGDIIRAGLGRNDRWEASDLRPAQGWRKTASRLSRPVCALRCLRIRLLKAEFILHSAHSMSHTEISILTNYACNSTDKQRGENPSDTNLHPPEKPQKI